ncbi:MAG: hypothetical protein P8I03_02785 [Thalassotalea sp.]|nr:hypothetical protein [Thalassotalea sp.]
MSYSYERQFAGHEVLAKQPLCKLGDLSCQYTREVFSQVVVDAYNGYTKDFNKSTWRAEQEFLLDQRHKFIHALMYENLEKQSLALPPHKAA